MEKGRAKLQLRVVLLLQQMCCWLRTHVPLSCCKLNNVCQQLINTVTTAFCREAARTLQIKVLCLAGERPGQRWVCLTLVSSE